MIGRTQEELGQLHIGLKEMNAYGNRSRGQCLGIVIMLHVNQGEAIEEYLRANRVWRVPLV